MQGKPEKKRVAFNNKIKQCHMNEVFQGHERTQNRKCLLCGNKDDVINYVRSKYSKLVRKEYKNRYLSYKNRYLFVFL